MDFNEKLVLLRKDRGLTQNQLSEKLHISRAAVWLDRACASRHFLMGTSEDVSNPVSLSLSPTGFTVMYGY